MPLSATDPRLRLVKTAFVIYHHTNLTLARTFLLDFGLQIAEERSDEIFFRGYGVEPFCYVARKAIRPDDKSYFGGAAYVVESRAELERATLIAGASGIQKLDAPGGGEMVTLQDPAGYLVHVVFGQVEHATPQLPSQLKKVTVNYEDEKPRKGSFQRFEPGPAPVFRWGHYGVTYLEGQYQAMFDWYTKHLALMPSDIAYKSEKAVTAFFHIDRGEEYMDHHSFFFKKAKSGDGVGVAHAAFEVHDFDIQQLGHDYLVKKNYKLCWGVGRHVLGSQVFDYWFDPSLFIVEHYADGDLVNNATPVAHVQAGPGVLSIWGPPVPDVF